MVLLGLDAADKGGKWSDFAGGGEPGDDTPWHTALRELDEETGGIVKVDHTQCIDEMHGVTPSGKHLHRYVVRIPFDSDLPSRFRESKDDEKVAIGWFALRQLPPLRRVFWSQMRTDGARIERRLVHMPRINPSP